MTYRGVGAGIAAVSLSVVALLPALPWEPDGRGTTVGSEVLEGLQRSRARAAARSRIPYGAPGAAQRYENAVRLPLDRSVNTRRAYRLARRHAAAMPRYSIATGRRLAGPELGGAPKRESRGRWRPLGPGNVGGRMRTLIVDPRRPETMYAGGVSGGVWKTTNGGRWWAPVGDELQNVAVNSMAMSPVDSRILYVGTGEGYFREDVRGTGLPLRGGGVFVTRDGGDSWAFLDSTGGEDFWFVNDLVFSPHDAERLYAATRTGVWRTEDAGDSWDRVLATDVQGGCLDLAMRSDRQGDTLFASCGTFEQARVHRNLDASGSSGWETVLEDPGMGRTSLALAPSDQDTVYALAASNEPGPYEQALHAVFRSDAGGAAGTWEARVRNTDSGVQHTLLLHNAVYGVYRACGFGADLFVPMGWYVNAVAVDPVDPDVVWAGGVDWFRSDDGGRTWGPASYWWADRRLPGYAHADQHVLAFHPDYDGAGNQTLFVGNDGGVFGTDNARAAVDTSLAGPCDPSNTEVAWSGLNRDLEVTQFYHGLPFPDGKALLGGTQDNGTVLQRRRDRNSWERILGGDGGHVAVDPRDTDVLYLEFQNGELRKSTDGGATVEPIRDGLPAADGRFLDPGGNFLFVTPFVMDPSDPDTLWVGGRYLFRTRDGAGLWERASRRLPGRARVSALAVAPSDSRRVAAGTDRGILLVQDDALAADGSTRWPRRRPRKAWVTSVTFDPGDPDVVYATYGGFGGRHVYRSANGGRRWRSIDGTGADGLPDIPVHVVVVDPDDPGRLFLGTDLGLFVTDDGGGSWAQENAGFGNIVTESLTLQSEGARLMLYAFTHGRGAWKIRVRPGG